MNRVYFYKDKNGNEPVLDYLNELSHQNGKDSRIKLKKYMIILICCAYMV